MEALQKQFGDKIRILPVTYEREDLVVNFWNKSKYLKGLQIPSVVEDSVVRGYFLHKAMPHEVWVYKGKVIAITNEEYVDEDNIRKILNGESISWRVKNDFYSFDGRKEPLFAPDTNQIDVQHSFLHYAATSGYREGVSYSGFYAQSGIVRDSIKNSPVLCCQCIHLYSLFLQQRFYTS